MKININLDSAVSNWINDNKKELSAAAYIHQILKQLANNDGLNYEASVNGTNNK